MKNKILTLILIIPFFSFGQVKLKFDNKTDKQITIKVKYGESTSPIEAFTEVFSQTISANTTTPEFIKIKKIKKYNKFIIMGSIDGLGRFKFFESTLVKRNQKFTIPLKTTVIVVPSDNTSSQSIISQLNFNPPANSKKVMSAEIAYNAYFGGLSLRKDSVEIDRIEPFVLKSKVSPIQYGSINKTIEVFFSGDFISNNKGEVPGIASVSINTSRNELYKLKYNLNDIGTIVWSNTNGKSVTTLFSELGKIDKVALINRYLNDSTLTLYQYDHMYLFESLTLQVDKYKKTSTIIDANVPIFFANNTAFKKENNRTFITTSNNTVLNIWAEKDVTNLMVQAAKDYLIEQEKIISLAKSNKDAQIIAESIFEKQNKITPIENTTKKNILENVNIEILRLNKILKIKL
jgi:hypothetical protein